MRYLPTLIVLGAVCLSACDRAHTSAQVNDFISVRDGTVWLQAPDHADATINAAGDLRVASTAITVTSAERELLKRYYTGAQAVRDHGIATGKAGVATAGKAIGSVASGLLHGDADKIDGDIQASVAKVGEQVSLICNDLAEMRTVQETLAGQLEAFRPYALIKAADVDDCRRGSKEHPRG